MKVRPVKLKEHEVIAILENRKTQLRRMVSQQPAPAQKWVGWLRDGKGLVATWAQSKGDMLRNALQIKCPFGQVGDRLWVREAWQHSNFPDGDFSPECAVFYRADYLDDPHGPSGEKSPEGKYREWNRATVMPKIASRITLEITEVRVEQTEEGLFGEWFWVIEFERVDNNRGAV